MTALGLDDGSKDVIVLHDGRTLETHGPSKCEMRFCCIHRPSRHALNDRPLMWRHDRTPPFMERICEHGVGHPDPDSLAWLSTLSIWGRKVDAISVHGCDGCCR